MISVKKDLTKFPLTLEVVHQTKGNTYKQNIFCISNHWRKVGLWAFTYQDIDPAKNYCIGGPDDVDGRTPREESIDRPLFRIANPRKNSLIDSTRRKNPLKKECFG